MKGLATYEILRGVYPEHKMGFFASLRMTSEGLRMTFSVLSVIRNRN